MYRRSSKWLSVAVALLFIGVVKIDVAKAASAGEGKGKPVDVSVRVYNSIPISIPQPTIGATPTTLTFDSEGQVPSFL